MTVNFQQAVLLEPDKGAIVKALEMGLGLGSVKGMADFGDKIGQLRPHVEATARWLDKHDHKLLPLVGLIL